jgi:hypothetical protein
VSPQFQTVFSRLREILKKHAGHFVVSRDTAGHYQLEAPVGSAALRAWGGQARSPVIPVAWVQTGKAYVSFHLMGVHGNPELLDGYSEDLRARMQGKSCFNFKNTDEVLFTELERLTADSIAGMKKAGFISEKQNV